MSKIKNGGLDQYGTEPFEQQQFGIAGVKGLKYAISCIHSFMHVFYEQMGLFICCPVTSGYYIGFVLVNACFRE